MDVTDDAIVGEALDGVAEDVSGDGLDDVFDEFGTVGFQAFPFLGGSGAFVGDGFSAELVCFEFWFDVGEASAGGKLDEEHSALAGEEDAVGLSGGFVVYG